ncbi:IS66 family insertion sequence element accessory protein TnpA [Zhaonella formicivorans]|uniref:IS66 family insertion sequence element accessory protein TnpA n=1 Tax=Zhaonella formicivorans TaxID=2528593 RepID=UPI001D11DF56|nr:helix-turn-helix domain-containing protein [Zhaonella formicivorans]
MTKEELRDFWAARVKEFKESGQSAPAWCVANNVKLHQLRYWLRKEKHTSTVTTLSWLPLNLSDAGFQTSLLVRVGQVAVEVKPGFDPKLLVDVVKALIDNDR